MTDDGNKKKNYFNVTSKAYCKVDMYEFFNATYGLVESSWDSF